MIELTNITKYYGNKLVFENVSLKIDAPGVYLIRGKSGSGESTLLNILAGITTYRGDLINEHKKSTSYVFQNSYLILHLDVKENLKLYGININVLKKFGLYNKKDDFVNSLSIGERSRVALIIGLYKDSEVVLIDEPITNLDINNAKKIIKEIFKFSKHKIIILISHEYKWFINKVNGIIDIRDKCVKFKVIKNNESNICRVNNSHKLPLFYLLKEWNYYKKDNVKLLMVSVITIMLIFSVLLCCSIFGIYVNKDIKNSLDYNKFYLSECIENNKDGISVKTCSNPSEMMLKELVNNGIDYELNLDYLLSLLYSREDLSVIKSDESKLKDGRYPISFNEVIANENYSLGDTIELESYLAINSRYNDIYYSEISLTVVGIYNDLTFSDDKNIYFDFELLESYFKGEMLINNKISLYDYFSDLEIESYKYLAFSEYSDVLKDSLGSKYEFYKTLLELEKQLNNIVDYFIISAIVLSLYLVFRFNKHKLDSKKKSNAYLIANSYSVIKSVFVSCFMDISIMFFASLIMVLVGFYFSINTSYLIVFTCLYIILVIVMTISFYNKKNVNNLIRCQV